MGIGALTALFIYVATADRLVLTIDEGTFLSSGVNVLHGAVPYRDFFANTGPGDFWLLALIFRFAGISLRSAHSLVALDCGLIIGLTGWLTARFAGRRAALAWPVLCLALFLSSPTYLVTNHRWDANALALGAMAACLLAIESNSRSAAFLAGLLGVLAAWVTPPVGLLAAVVAFRLLLDRKTWTLVPRHLAGAALGTVAPAAWLASQGGLGPMFDSLWWNASHYSGANLVPYGFLMGGPAALFGGAHGIEWVARILFAFAFLLPAILPLAAGLAWLPALRDPRRPEAFLLLCGIALVASNYPRCDLTHLVYVCPVFLVLGAAWLQRHVSGLACVVAFLVPFLPALAMSRQNLAGAEQTVVATSVGSIRISQEDAPSLGLAVRHVRAGDSLFVFPYEPIFYFVTQGRNPTGYPWLQPGMMSDQDERAALAELSADPPKWILYRALPAEAYLRVWPGADPARLRMPLIEEFIRGRYVDYAAASSGDGERRLLVRR
ncbi:MAG: hypothetical protein JST11_19930 [Acidobacteria bacterium]|nr:hypothetical protein [Acidobacteriota bacterium]